MRPRLLFVITVLARDGVSRALEALATHLAPSYDVAVCSLTTAEAGAAARLRAAGVQVHALGTIRKPTIAAAWGLARLCRQFQPAIIHSHLSRADWIGRVVGRVLGQARVISTIHNVHSLMFRAEFGPLGAATGIALDRCTAPLVHHLVAVSHGVRADIERSGFPEERITVIPVGVDVARRSAVHTREWIRAAWGLGHGSPVIGAVALLKRQKGLFDLVDAVAELSLRGCEATVMVLGDGPLKGLLEQRAAALCAGPARIRFAGWVDDAMAWMPGFDLFVQPSHWEGLPVALLEAMSLGIAAVGTRVSGIEDVLEDNVSGWLVERGRPDALAACLAHALAAESNRTRVGSTGRRLVEERFSAKTVAALHDRLYQRLLL